MNKKCSKCKKIKVLTEFYLRTGTELFHSQCKECEKEASKEWYLKNPEYRREKTKLWRDKNKDRVREYKIKNKMKMYFTDSKRKYGITEERFNRMLSQQKNKCCGCGMMFKFGDKNTTPNIDHCHKTGKIRGLLCRRCNSVLGYFKDNPKPLIKLARYLKCHGI